MPKPILDITLILDRSGSMASLQNDVIGGFNTFLKEQRSNDVVDARLTLIQFDHEFDTIHECLAVADVPDLSPERYKPRGSTALYDAIGMAIQQAKARAKGVTIPGAAPSRRIDLDLEIPKQTFLFVIFSDGEENSSKKYKGEQILEMIKAQEDKGWQFVYMGTTIDQLQEAASVGLGTTPGQQILYTPTSTGVGTVFSELSKAYTIYTGTLSSTQGSGDFNRSIPSFSFSTTLGAATLVIDGDS
jgi:hypothetical protein